MGGLAGEIDAAERLGQNLARGLPARAGRRHRAEREWRGVPARRAGFLHRGCRPRCRTAFVSHSTAKATMAFSPWAERSRPKEPPTSIVHSDEPPILANISAVSRRIALLDDDVVARKPERIARNCSTMRS